MFNLTIKNINELNKIEEKGIIVDFLLDDENLKQSFQDYIVNNNIKINSALSGKFLEKDSKELFLQGIDDNPYLTVFKKLKITKKFDNDFFRDFVSSLIIKFENEPVKNLYINIPDFELVKDYFKNEEYYYSTFIEGLFLGNYQFTKYKSDKKELKKLNVFLVTENKKISPSLIKRTENLMKAVYLSRDLTNEIADVLTPQELLKQAKSELSKDGVTIKVFTKEQLEKLGMNGVIAVGKGSTNPPLMMVLEYKPKTKTKGKIALVGKGVTYDAGGLCIKTASGMLDMKGDMAGAGVVIGVIKAAALNKLPVHIIGVIPAVENVISGNSFKPGDIIKTYSGKTIEVIDTDAEGRIILSDALTYACKQKPDLVLDYATLTGACVVALGESAAGLFTNDDKLAENLLCSSKKTGERLWQFPMWDEYKKPLESDLADVKNLGIRWGSAIIAAKFLENFVDEEMSWAHLDIAGPAIKYNIKSYTNKYNTGFGVRLTYDYLEELAK